MLSIERLDNLIHRAGPLFLAGLACTILAHVADVGAVIAMHLVGYGALLGCVESYKSERGIWMLALLFGLGFLAIAVLCEFCMLRDLLRGAPRPAWTVVFEFAIALQVQWLMVRTLFSVVVHNRRLTSRRDNAHP